jgi:hypothetical protein
MHANAHRRRRRFAVAPWIQIDFLSLIRLHLSFARMLTFIRGAFSQNLLDGPTHQRAAFLDSSLI